MYYLNTISRQISTGLSFQKDTKLHVDTFLKDRITDTYLDLII